MNQVLRQPLKPAVWVLFFMMSVASVAAVICAPALPQIQEHLRLSTGETQSIMTVFLMGYSFGALLWGPIADGYGRKRALMWGFALATVGSLLCLVPEFFGGLPLLLVGRFLSALGGASGLTLAVTLLHDTHNHREASRLLPVLAISFGLLPTLGALLGGLVAQEFGWASTFVLTLGYFLFLALITARLPETRPSGSQVSVLGQYRRYPHFFRNPRLVLYAAMVGFSTALIYVYFAAAPLAMRHEFDVGPRAFGLWNLLPLVAYSLGNIAMSRFLRRMETGTSLLIGVVLVVIVSFGMLGLRFSGDMNVPRYFIGTALLLVSMTFLWSASSLSATQGIRAEDKGTASAVLTFFNLGCPVLATLLLSLRDGAPLESGLELQCLIAVVLLALFGVTRPLRRRADPLSSVRSPGA